ncbi:MAG: hypothetical protein HUU38_15110 [Anaerolineales bacterium]|nr:hypothetical protein [Anaerolineales bacterium]
MFKRIWNILFFFCVLGILSGSSLGAATALPNQSPNIRHVSSFTTITQVDAEQTWQATSITVTTEQTIRFEVVSGLWTHWIGTVPYNNGVGGDYICGNPGCVEPLPTAPTGALIGKIGNYIFHIGSGTTITLQESGLLYLRINDEDNGLYDNDGILTVSVDEFISHTVYLPTVTRGQPKPIVTKTVFTVAYMDAIPIYDPDDIQVQFISDLKLASTWHGNNNPNGQPALGYQTYGGSVIKIFETPPYRSDNGKFDYAAVYERFDLCNKIQAGEVDEVWVWESGTGNAWEWVTNGPYWSWTWDANVPNCGRTITSMNLNYQRDVGLALHSFGHRMEGAFMNWRPCDFYTESWPWIGWPSFCSGLVSDQFGYVARPFTGNNNIGVCGDIHHPPNIPDNREYIYNDPFITQSICEDWQWDGSATAQSFDCSIWGCEQRGFMIWWMQNIPGYGNNTKDRYGNIMPNWWDYLFLDQSPPYNSFTEINNLEKDELLHYFFHSDLTLP